MDEFGHELPDGSPGAEASIPVGRRLSLLAGVRVVDLTHFLAGPFASMVLADLGADVTKIEPLSGDATRNNPPYYLGEDSAYFLAINRNKRSIAMNLRSDTGQQILDRMIRHADVVLDNMRASQRESLGLAFPDLVARNSRIVSCSVTGFGSNGPYQNRPAYDIIVEALAGIMSVTGPEGGPSVRAGVPIGDITAGLYVAIGVLAALHKVHETGEGQHVDISMLDSQVSLLSYLAQYYFTGGLIAKHQGRAHVSIPTYNTFATSDGGEIVIAANTEEMWKALCSVLGREDLVSDLRFASNTLRLEHRDELVPVLAREFASRPTTTLHEALVEAGVPAAPINAIDEALRDPQIRHREMVIQVRHHSGEDLMTLGTPLKSSTAQGEEFVSPPMLGGDTVALLGDLGYSSDEITELCASGDVKAHP